MEILNKKYSIYYDTENAILFCKGILELRGKEGYQEIVDILDLPVNSKPPLITLDIRELEFLNSSGVTTLGGFIIRIRKKGKSRLKVIGANKYSWQARSLKGLQKLMPSMELEFE